MIPFVPNVVHAIFYLQLIFLKLGTALLVNTCSKLVVDHIQFNETLFSGTNYLEHHGGLLFLKKKKSKIESLCFFQIHCISLY